MKQQADIIWYNWYYVVQVHWMTNKRVIQNIAGSWSFCRANCVWTRPSRFTRKFRAWISDSPCARTVPTANYYVRRDSSVYFLCLSYVLSFLLLLVFSMQSCMSPQRYSKQNVLTSVWMCFCTKDDKDIRNCPGSFTFLRLLQRFSMRSVYYHVILFFTHFSLITNYSRIAA